MGQLVLVVAVAVIVAFIVSRYLGRQKNRESSEKSLNAYHYRRKDFLMSRSEHEFFDILIEKFGNSYYVFPQVNLSVILDYTIKGQSWNAARAHINRMSVDYVICDKSYIKPLVAIELDDPSHEKEDRQIRDADIERIFKEASLPLVRFSDTNEMDNADIIQRITEKLPVSH